MNAVMIADLEVCAVVFHYFKNMTCKNSLF